MTALEIDPHEWRNRCARRILELDPQITAEEAETIAADVHAFERTRAMAPEAAADFIAEQMNRPDPPRFERRAKDRPARLPLARSILRMLTPRRVAVG
jgi:hypothetical protein